MQRDNVTPFKKPTKSLRTDSLSLVSVYDTIQAWRKNKKTSNEKIPTAIWDQVFTLLNTMDESHVLKALGLTTSQLFSKRQERQSNQNPVIEDNYEKPEEVKSTEFCEAIPKIPLAYKPAKAFATNTSVVELYRPDGMLMKIHICTDSFEDLLRAFFKG